VALVVVPGHRQVAPEGHGAAVKKRNPILSLQVPGASGRYEEFYRVECESSARADVRAALETILKEGKATRIGSKQPPTSFRPGKHNTPVLKAEDLEQIPGVEADVEADAVVERALA
jgi:hypothetical protein